MCIFASVMLVDIPKLDSALKFLAKTKKMSLRSYLQSIGLSRNIIYYFKCRDTPSLYLLEKIFKSTGLNPNSFILTPSKTTVPFNPITDLINPEHLVDKNNLNLFFKYLVYSYGDFLLNLSFLHKFFSREFPDIRMDLTIYGDKKHAELSIHLSPGKILYIYFKLWHNKLYICLADHTIPVENFTDLAYDCLTYDIILKYLRIIDLNTTLVKPI